MKRSAQIYIDVPNEGLTRLELFNDENIEVVSSVQNIADISKVFTDFSQSFTVPASTINNRIFQHFYNSDFDGNIDHQLRRNAAIEIDLIPFRTGKIQLEKSNLKDGHVSSYTITFYGDVRTLKDAFGEQKLSQLDFSAFSFEYTGANIQDTITNPSDLSVRFPLISSSRLWQYANPTIVFDNIDEATDSIKYTELFPALKVKDIFDIIQSTFNINFQGLFLSNKRFTNAFLYLKNRETCNFASVGQRLDMISVSYSDPIITNDAVVDFALDTVHYTNMQPSGLVTGTITTTITISNVTAPTAPYFIDIYVNDVLVNTVTGMGNTTYTVLTDQGTNIDNTAYYVMRCSTNMSYSSSINLMSLYIGGTVPMIIDVKSVTIQCATQTAVYYLDLAMLMPEMKIADFFAGVLKEMNLTCYALNANTFQIEPLEDWYNKGAIYDMSQYTIIDEIDIQRMPLYKNIAFKHEVSQSFMNVEFFNNFNLQYGDLTYAYPYDGTDYTIQVPFENIMFNKFDNNNLQVGYCLTKSPDFKPYIPKPIILYLYDQKDCLPFYFNDSATDNIINTYMPFGQDLLYNNQNYSLNFGQNISTLLLASIPNSLFQTYYFNYLSNLYQKKNRLTTLKMNFPLSILTKLRLNDRLVIRDKRYIINEMKSSLTTGIVTLTLINDFRLIQRAKPSKGDKGGVGSFGTVKSTVLLANRTLYAEIDITGTGILSTDYTTIYEDTEVTFTVPGIAETTERITEDSIYRRVTEDSKARINEESSTPIYAAKITYYFENDYTEIDYIILTQ